MISTIPVMIIFISSILKIEKTNIFQILGVSCSFIGVVLIITKANLEILVNLDFNKGDITMVFGMLSWATYSVLLKKKKHELSQLTLLEVVISFGFIFLIPIYFIEYQMDYRIKLGILEVKTELGPIKQLLPTLTPRVITTLGPIKQFEPISDVPNDISNFLPPKLLETVS